MTAINLTCPQCGQIDSVRKVSSIVNAGTSSSTYSGYGDGIGYSRNGITVTDEYINITGSTQTQLSQLLSPPIQPQANYFEEYTLIMVIAGVIGLFVAVFGLIQILISQFATGIFLLVLGILCFGICVWIAVRYPDLNKNNEIRFKKELLAWEKAVSKWQKLYYCYRCDGVFLSGLNYIVTTQHMMDFLYYKKAG